MCVLYRVWLLFWWCCKTHNFTNLKWWVQNLKQRLRHNDPFYTIVVLVFSVTVAADLVSLLLQVLGAVCKSTKLSETTQKGLLLLLRMSCQHPLSQTQFLVGLLLMTGRYNRTRRSAMILAGFCCLPRTWNVFCDLWMNDSETATLTYFQTVKGIKC